MRVNKMTAELNKTPAGYDHEGAIDALSKQLGQPAHHVRQVREHSAQQPEPHVLLLEKIVGVPAFQHRQRR